MIGETLGSYRIVSELGQGGMGVVYAAEHTVLGRRAAVKVLRAGQAEEHVERFFNEARAAARLQHPGLVEVFDFGNHAGRAFIVMELLAGESLQARLEREPRLPFSVAGYIARAVANALHVAHQEGIIHRDLKPANIFLVPDDEAAAGVRAKVLDFGIAKLARDEPPRSVRTHSGVVIGTPRYMSPEQCRNARSVDARADVYSLGCILYEMVLGVAPFDYDTWAELVGAHLHEQPRRPHDLDPQLAPVIAALILRMIAKAPEDRYTSMPEVARAIEEALEATGEGPVRRSSPPVRDSPSPTRGRVITPGGGVTTRSGTDPTLPLASDSGEGRLEAAGAPTLEQPERDRPAPAPAPSPSHRRRWLFAVGAVAAVAAGATALWMVSQRSGNPPAEAVVTVEDRTQPTVPVAPPAPVPAPARPEHPPEVSAPVPREVDTAQLTRAFSRHTSELTRCFRDQKVDAGEQLSVRFQIDTHGKVITATVQPETVAGSALGKCIAAVARTITFGPQPKAVTFRAPIQAVVKGS